MAKFMDGCFDYIKGLIEILKADTPRYCFVIENLDVIYVQESIGTWIDYTPVGCYRPVRKCVSDLNNEIICRQFKPDHARMIIGIDVLEKNLDFNDKDQAKIYLSFIKKCSNTLKDV